MIEKLLKDYLDGVLSYPVRLEKPSDPSDDEYIVMERTADMQTNYVRNATIALQTYAQSLYRAARMAEEVADVLEDAVEVDDITSVEINSIYNFTDRLTKSYRYQVVVSITYYRGDLSNG